MSLLGRTNNFTGQENKSIYGNKCTVCLTYIPFSCSTLYFQLLPVVCGIMGTEWVQARLKCLTKLLIIKVIIISIQAKKRELKNSTHGQREEPLNATLQKFQFWLAISGLKCPLYVSLTLLLMGKAEEPLPVISHLNFTVLIIICAITFYGGTCVNWK